MNISIILAHPNPKSFNHAIAQAAMEALARNNHTPALHDLYQENFPALLTTAEFQTDAKLNPVIAQHCRETAAADGIIIVHPNWWDMPPAILKGWIDRVLRPEIAYRFGPNDKGEIVSFGLLKAKSAIIFNTANTPEENTRGVFGDPLEGLWKKCVFGLCGVRDAQRRTFTPVIASTPPQRAGWLREAGEMVARQFPAAPKH
jgi:putative NADPH-quinone reductase